VEKANGDRDGEEELDEFELEKRAIGLKIKGAIETDETDQAVKALMAVAKEHELQCAAPPRRRAAPRRAATAPPPPGTLHSATPVAARPARSARPALCSAPCSARLARTLPLQRSALSLRALSGTLRAARVQVRRPLRLHLRGRAGRERGQAGDLAQGAAACRELSRMSWWCHSSLACCPGRLGREGTFGPGLLFLGLRGRAPPPLRPQWLLSVCADAHPCRALPPTPPPTSTSHSPLPGRAG
jgi:hypothetical protein